MSSSFLLAVAARAKDAASPPPAGSTVLQQVLADRDLIRSICQQLPEHARARHGRSSHSRRHSCSRCAARRVCRMWSGEVEPHSQRKAHACECVRAGHRKLRHFGPTVRGDREVAFEALRHASECERLRGLPMLQYASGACRDDLDLMTAAVQLHPFALKHASERLRDCAELVRLAASIDPTAVWLGSERLRTDDDVLVRAALRRTRTRTRLDGSRAAIADLWLWYGNGGTHDLVLQHSHPRPIISCRQCRLDMELKSLPLWHCPLQGCPHCPMQTCPHSMGLGEPLASARLVVPKEPAHAQRRVVSAQRGHISHSGTGVRTPCGALLASEAIARRWGGCGARFWQDAEFVLEACSAYAPVLGDGRLADRFRDDDACVRAAASAAHGTDEVHVLECASARLRDDRALVLDILGMEEEEAQRQRQEEGEEEEWRVRRPTSLRHASERLRDDEEVVLAAVRRPPHGLGLEYASARLRAQREVALAACRSHPLALQFCDPAFQDDDAFVLSADALRYASPRLQDDDELVQRLVKRAGREAALVHASERLRRHYEERYELAAGGEYARLRMSA